MALWNELSKVDVDNIAALTIREEWKSFEKLLNNTIFKHYKRILVDEDVKTARKLIYFATAIKNIAKSKNAYGKTGKIYKESDSEQQETLLIGKDGEIFL